MVGIDFQLALELLARLLILLRLPVKIAEPEMNIWLLGRQFCCSLELRNGLLRSSQPVESLAHQNVGRSRLRTLLEQLTKLLLRTLQLLGPQAALRKLLMQFRIRWVRFRAIFEILRGQIELPLAVIAHSQQRPGLQVRGVGLEESSQRDGRRRKLS